MKIYDTTPTDDILTAKQMHDALPNAGRIYGSEESHIETFLTVNADEIPPDNRAKIRECVAKGANPNRFCPPHLRDALRRIITEAQYQARSKGKMFNPKGEYMPTGGKCSTIKLSTKWKRKMN